MPSMSGRPVSSSPGIPRPAVPRWFRNSQLPLVRGLNPTRHGTLTRSGPLTVEQLEVLLEKQIRPLAEKVDKLGRQMGFIVESSLRLQIGQMFGDAYQRPLLVRSLQDLALLLPVEDNSKLLLSRIEQAKSIGRKLIEEDIPRKLLMSLQTGYEQKTGKELRWFGSDGSVDVKSIELFLQGEGNNALAHAIRRLRKVLLLPGEEQLDHILTCESAGVMCVLAAGCPEEFLNSSTAWPGEVLEFDVRGRFEMTAAGNSAYIDVGEIKSSKDYRSAIHQLGIRLKVLRWLAINCLHAEASAVRLVGRLFVGGCEDEGWEVDAQQRALAYDLWGYSLYLHVL